MGLSVGRGWQEYEWVRLVPTHLELSGVMKQPILSHRYSPRDTGCTVTAQTSAECCLEFAHWAKNCLSQLIPLPQNLVSFYINYDYNSAPPSTF